jgi:sialidase-1
VVDRQTGIIWLLTTQNLGTDREKDILAGTGKSSRTVWVLHSRDDGMTWSGAVEMTSEVKKADWTWYATGPGVGIQIRATGRLVIPANHAEAGTGVHRSHLFFSDDHGATWKLGAVADAGTNESQVVELSGGRLMLTMRNHPPKAENFRMVATSEDGGVTLSPARPDPALIEPPAQASLIALPDSIALPRGLQPRSKQGGPAWLLFANPASAKRERMTVRLSRDEGETWGWAGVVYEGPAAYSSLAVLPDSTIGLLYERGERSPYEKITFARFSLDWLTALTERN